MTNRLPIALALIAASLTTAASGQLPSGWNGDYRYEYSGGRTAGGTGIVVTYKLHLDRDGCRLHAEGWQTDETIRCTVAPNAGVIDIRFKSYGDGQVANKYGVLQFKPGERLFSLSNRRGIIWTGWGSYSPWESKQPLGRHFRKVG